MLNDKVFPESRPWHHLIVVFLPSQKIVAIWVRAEFVMNNILHCEHPIKLQVYILRGPRGPQVLHLDKPYTRVTS